MQHSNHTKTNCSKVKKPYGSRLRLNGSHVTPLSVGQRVGVILKIEKQPPTVYFVGFGKFVGDEVPSPPLLFENVILRYMVTLSIRVPKFEMDDSSIVYGPAGWWAPEQQMNRILEKCENNGYEIVRVSTRG